MSLKKKSQKNLKILFAMGGTYFAPEFSTIFATSITRNVFVESCAAFVARYGFDGINIDWHYPRDDRENNDKKNFVSILKMLRNEFSKQNDNKALTITIPEKPFDTNGFDIPNLDYLVDFYCLTSYNYHTTDERSVHHHATLFKNERHQACNDDLQLTINDTVNMYIRWNITREKLIVGIPLFGSCYKLEDSNNNNSLLVYNLLSAAIHLYIIQPILLLPYQGQGRLALQNRNW